MTEGRKNKIALIVTGGILKIKYVTDSVDRFACSEAGFLDFGDTAKPPTQQLRLLMKKLVENPDILDVDGFAGRDGELAYVWLIHHLKQQPVDFVNLHRMIGSMAEKLLISETQFVEFYRLLYVDIVNKVLQQFAEEVPLIKKHKKTRKRQG